MDKAIQVFKIRRKKFITDVFDNLGIDVTEEFGQKALRWLKNELLDLEKI